MVKVQLLDLEMEMAGSNHLVKIIYFFLKLGYLYVFSFCLLGGVWGLDSSLSYGPKLAFTDTIYDVNNSFHFEPRAQPNRPPTSGGGYPYVDG